MAKLDKHTINTQIVLLEGLKTKRPVIYNDDDFMIYIEGINTSIDILRMLLSNDNNVYIKAMFKMERI